MTDADRDELLVRLDENVAHINSALPTLQTQTGCAAAQNALRSEFSAAALTLLRTRVWQVVTIVITAGVVFGIGKL
jgi:hypothetical protein